MTQVDSTLGAAVVAPVEAVGLPMATAEPTGPAEAPAWSSPVVQTLALTAGPSTSDAPRIPPRRTS